MKKTIQKLLLSACVSASALTVNAQQAADFENLTLAPNSYWNGSTHPKGTSFISADAIFPNYFDGYWSSGWAYSNKTDSTTAGYTNMYSAVAAKGYNGSANYGIGTNGSIIKLQQIPEGLKAKGVYITNGTYAALSMRDGDGAGGFARRFGDTTMINSGKPHGDVKDWFKLTIKGYHSGVLKADSVDFYLADYRFDDNSKDYIVRTWEWVNLEKLGIVDSVLFLLSSSDVGKFGMNTPAYFCIDNFTTGSPTFIATTNLGEVKMYPNPATDYITIDLTKLNGVEPTTINIFDVAGKLVETHLENDQLINLPISIYKPGVYFVSIKNTSGIINAKFIKE
ncbi:MAG TPA: DUF4465 domain-containing protein [Bacteroidia bacterium]|jgi:hypothetical protein|nr:DUF4465 domain-containing protein [Bacteroidia bacterium]